MIRYVKIALILAVALWGLVGGIFNLINWNGTLGSVGAATSMATFEGGPESWQATSNGLLIWLGALFIMLSKLLAAGLCLIGAARMWGARTQDADAFTTAKQLAIAGCGVAMFMLFTGFIVVAETWFELWRSDEMRGPVLDSAFRYGGMITLIALFVSAKND